MSEHVIESGIPPPARKSCNHHKPSPWRELAKAMKDGDSVIVDSRNLFALANQINQTGSSYTYLRLSPHKARVWKIPRES